MEITHLGHAAVLIQTAGARILIDPGAFSDAWHDLADLDAILVTHQHPDHLDQAHLAPLLLANRGARLLVEASVADLLPTDFRAVALAPEARTTVGDVELTAVGGRHAVIHPEISGIGNVGMVLRSEGEPTFFHPGDAYDTSPEDVDVLAVPINAPWAKLYETVEFVRRAGPVRWLPIHDALLSGRGRALYVNRVADLTPAELLDLQGHGSAVI